MEERFVYFLWNKDINKECVYKQDRKITKNYASKTYERSEL